MNFGAVSDQAYVVSVADFETFAIELSPTNVTAADGPQSGGRRRHPVGHFQDTAKFFTFRIVADRVAPEGGLAVGYTITDVSTVEGTHYDVPSISTSPAIIPGGLDYVDVFIGIIDTGAYHTERQMTIQLTETGTNALASVDTTTDELRVLIEATRTAPEIEFDIASQTVAAGATATVTVNKVAGGTAHDDNIALYFFVDPASTMVEDTDYTWSPTDAAIYGVYTISPAASSRDVSINILAGATSGRTLIIGLWHDLSDGSDENLWAMTHDMRYEEEVGKDWAITQGFPGFPSDNGIGPAAALVNDTTPLFWAQDGTLLDPFGNPVWVVEQKANAVSAGYHRKNLNNWLYCGAELSALQALTRYVRFSIYVRPPTTGTVPRFVQLGVRNRGATFAAPQTINGSDSDNFVLFDNESTDGSAVSHEGLSWYIYDPTDVDVNGDPNDLVGSTGGIGCDWGIETETHRMSDGTTDTLLRLWIIYHEGDATLLGNQLTIIWWPIQTKSGEVGVEANDGRRLCCFWPMQEMSNTLLSGAPPRFRPREGYDWNPLGNATINSSGTNTHTITVT